MKLLYLGIRNITGRHIDGEGLARERGERGTGTYGWKRALNALAVRIGDRRLTGALGRGRRRSRGLFASGWSSVGPTTGGLVLGESSCHAVSPADR